MSNLIEPTSIEEIKDLYGNIDNKSFIIADYDINNAVKLLKEAREEIAILEHMEKIYTDEIACYMKDKANLITEDGEELVWFKKTSPSVIFDAKKFKAENEELYSEYLIEKEGSRRFLVKGV